jgi:hypothetical protein
MERILLGLLIVGLIWLILTSFIVGFIHAAERMHKASEELEEDDF